MKTLIKCYEIGPAAAVDKIKGVGRNSRCRSFRCYEFCPIKEFCQNIAAISSMNDLHSLTALLFVLVLCYGIEISSSFNLSVRGSVKGVIGQSFTSLQSSSNDSREETVQK